MSDTIRDNAVDALDRLPTASNPEHARSNAAEILRNALNALGYADIVKAYERAARRFQWKGTA